MAEYEARIREALKPSRADWEKRLGDPTVGIHLPGETYRRFTEVAETVREARSRLGREILTGQTSPVDVDRYWERIGEAVKPGEADWERSLREILRPVEAEYEARIREAASGLPPRGTGLAAGTARTGLERGRGRPLSEEERVERHYGSANPEEPERGRYAWIKFNYDVEEFLDLKTVDSFIFYMWRVDVREGRQHLFYVFLPLVLEASGEEPVVVVPKGLPREKVRHALLLAAKYWLEDALDIHPGEEKYVETLEEVREELGKTGVRAVARPHAEVFGYEVLFLSSDPGDPPGDRG